MNLLTKTARIYLFGAAIYWVALSVMNLAAYSFVLSKILKGGGIVFMLPFSLMAPLSVLFGNPGVFHPFWGGPDPIMFKGFFTLLFVPAAGLGFVALKMVSRQKEWIYIWYVYSGIYIVMSLFSLIDVNLTYNRFWPVLIQYVVFTIVPGCILLLATYLIHRNYRGLATKDVNPIEFSR